LSHAEKSHKGDCPKRSLILYLIHGIRQSD
jgi:hypothetical protein